MACYLVAFPEGRVEGFGGGGGIENWLRGKEKRAFWHDGVVEEMAGGWSLTEKIWMGGMKIGAQQFL